MALGAEGIDADKVAHEVMAPGGQPYEPLGRRPSGRTCCGRTARSTGRSWARCVFRDPAALARLEAIVHPAVYEVTQARVDDSTAPVVVIEAIKLLEAGLSVTCATRCGS